MTFYSFALFLHIVGTMALGLEWVNLLRLRRAVTAEKVRELQLWAEDWGSV